MRFGPSRHGPDDEPALERRARADPDRRRSRAPRAGPDGPRGLQRAHRRLPGHRLQDRLGAQGAPQAASSPAGGRCSFPSTCWPAPSAPASVPARGEAQYFFASRYGNFQRVTFTNEDYEARREELERILSSFSEGMRTGNFHARPGDQCRYCDFDSLCDARRHTILDRKREDPRVREMDEIGEIP
ncbi:MAG: PD-(D/E)XK nuclease family protein [Thermoleophilaceae bacterium]